MNLFFEWLSGIFESLGLYSDALSKYLQGLNFLDSCDDFNQHAYYTDIFLWFFGVNSIIMFNYYFVFFNATKYSSIKVYLVNILASCILMFVISYSICNNIFVEIPDGCLNQYPLQTNDFLNFGLATAIWSFIYCILLTAFFKFIFHYKPELSNNRKVPF
jgi:hypothetical protein